MELASVSGLDYMNLGCEIQVWRVRPYKDYEHHHMMGYVAWETDEQGDYIPYYKEL